MFRLSTRKLNGVAVKDGASFNNKILPFIDTSSLCNAIEDGLGEAVLEDDLIYGTEQQITPKLSGLAPAHTRAVTTEFSEGVCPVWAGQICISYSKKLRQDLVFKDMLKGST
jgi:hypothetical protein